MKNYGISILETKVQIEKSQDLSQIPIKNMWSRNFSAFAIKTTSTNFATDKQIKALKNHEINNPTMLYMDISDM